MNEKLKVTIASYSSSLLNSLEATLNDCTDLLVERLLVPESKTSSLDLDLESCDVLVLGLTDEWEKLLSLVGTTPLVVVGSASNTEMMRLSFKAGATDFLYDAAAKVELHTAITNAQRERQKTPTASAGDVTVFVSPKGGAGATTLSVHLSHILSTRDHQPDVLLMDLDFQYGNLPLHFNEKPTSRLSSALSRGEKIDSSNFDACVSQVHPKLHTLASHSEQLLSPWEMNTIAVESLLNLANQGYDHVLIDVPRTIDPVTFCALEKANRICVIVQQTLSDMHVAHQYVKLLHEQGIASETISIVVNRFEKSNVIHLEDFENAFAGLVVHGVPNDYKRVSFSSENTVPLIRKWRNSVITKNLVQFAERCWPDESKPRRWSFSYAKESDRAA